MFQIWLSRVCSISEQRRKPVACRVYKNHTTILHVRCAADHILDRAAQTNTVPAQRNLPFRSRLGESCWDLRKRLGVSQGSDE
jgi:hypothetical protein